jgi:predicted DNA-binding protein YlxM (UPF0122 family)
VPDVFGLIHLHHPEFNKETQHPVLIYNSIMKNKFKHLSVFDRVRIEQKYKEGWSLGRIAKNMGRSKSSVSREINKNKSKVLSIYKKVFAF